MLLADLDGALMATAIGALAGSALLPLLASLVPRVPTALRMTVPRMLAVLGCLAVALLGATLIRPQARFLTSSAAWPFIICGRNSLYIFCLGILLSVVGHLVLNEFFGGLAMQFAVSVAGVVIMIAVAAQGTPGGGAVGAPTASKGARG